MRVHPTQLVEGCVLLKDVLGKSGRPIMKQNTVLTNEHITVLHKFFIDSVEVSSQLENGETFHPNPPKKDKRTKKKKTESIYLENEESRSFHTHYLEVVEFYKQSFLDWGNGIPIDLLKIRKEFIPLLERMEELDIELFTLHQFGTKQDYLYHHGVSVGLLAAFLGKELGYRKGEWVQIGLSGFLSDCGMTKVDKSVLNKVGPLTKSQMETIRNHPIYSYHMVENLTGLSKNAKLGVLQHHERMDGSGYPLGLGKERITPYAQIIAIADIYNAITSERLYKSKQSIIKAIDEIFQGKYIKFESKIVHRFMKSLSDSIVGKTVRLTNNKTAEIVFVDEEQPTNLLIKLHENKEVTNLPMDSEIDIEEIILN